MQKIKRTQTFSSSKVSCKDAVNSTATIVKNIHGTEFLCKLTHENFYGLMLQYSPVKPYEFNGRTIERALRRYCQNLRQVG